MTGEKEPAAFQGHLHENAPKEKNMRAQLASCRTTSPFDKSDFIPLGCILDLITTPNVKAELRGNAVYTRDLATSSPRVKGDVIIEYARTVAQKLFVILTCLGSQHHIVKFYQHRFTDRQLRFDKATLLSIVRGRSRANVAIWKPFEDSGLDSTDRIHDFCTYQWQVLAPAFDAYPRLYKLLGDTPIPVTWSESHGGGGFSNVHLVQIHPDHWADE
jgi:hypothetical protein